MNGMWWKQGAPKDREVSQAEVDRAQALNYNAAGPLLSAGMSRAGLGTDAANKMVWARKQAEWEASRRPGVVNIATDPNANPGLARIPTDGTTRTFAPTAPSQLQVDRMAATKLVNDDPAYGRFWETPEQQAATRAAAQASRGNSQARIDSQTPTYRGMAGVGLGNVNGRAELYPIAGRVGEYSQNMGAVGLSGQGGTSVADYEGARAGLVAQQEQGRRGARFEAQKATKAANAQALALKQVDADAEKYKADATERATGLKVDREMNALFRQQLDKHDHDVRYIKGRYDKEQRTRNAIGRATRMLESGPGTTVMMPDGTPVAKGQVEAYLLDKARLEPGGMPPMEEYAANLGYDLTPPVNPYAAQPTTQAGAQPPGAPPATSAAPAAGAPDQPFKSGYTRAQLDQVSDRPKAIARLRQAGDEEGARYLEGKG